MTIDRRTLLTGTAAAAAVAALPASALAEEVDPFVPVYVENNAAQMIDAWERGRWWKEIDAYLDRRIPHREMAEVVSMVNRRLILNYDTLFDWRHRHSVSAFGQPHLMDGLRLEYVNGARAVDVNIGASRINPMEGLDLTPEEQDEVHEMVIRGIALEVVSGLTFSFIKNFSEGLTPRWLLPLIPCDEDIASGKLTGRFRSWHGWTDEQAVTG